MIEIIKIFLNFYLISIAHAVLSVTFALLISRKTISVVMVIGIIYGLFILGQVVEDFVYQPDHFEIFKYDENDNIIGTKKVPNDDYVDNPQLKKALNFANKLNPGSNLYITSEYMREGCFVKKSEERDSTFNGFMGLKEYQQQEIQFLFGMVIFIIIVSIIGDGLFIRKDIN